MDNRKRKIDDEKNDYERPNKFQAVESSVVSIQDQATLNSLIEQNFFHAIDARYLITILENFRFSEKKVLKSLCEYLMKIGLWDKIWENDFNQIKNLLAKTSRKKIQYLGEKLLENEAFIEYLSKLPVNDFLKLLEDLAFGECLGLKTLMLKKVFPHLSYSPADLTQFQNEIIERQNTGSERRKRFYKLIDVAPKVPQAAQQSATEAPVAPKKPVKEKPAAAVTSTGATDFGVLGPLLRDRAPRKPKRFVTETVCEFTKKETWTSEQSTLDAETSNSRLKTMTSFPTSSHDILPDLNNCSPSAARMIFDELFTPAGPNRYIAYAVDICAGIGGINDGVSDWLNKISAQYNVKIELKMLVINDASIFSSGTTTLTRTNVPELYKEIHPDTVFEGTHLFNKKLEDINWKNVKKELNDYKISFVFFSPPCWSYSIAGKRQGSSSQDGKVLEDLKFIEVLQAKIIFIEEVNTLITDSKFADTLDTVKNQLLQNHYQVSYESIGTKGFTVAKRDRAYIFAVHISCIPQAYFPFNCSIPKPIHVNLCVEDILGQRYRAIYDDSATPENVDLQNIIRLIEDRVNNDNKTPCPEGCSTRGENHIHYQTGKQKKDLRVNFKINEERRIFKIISYYTGGKPRKSDLHSLYDTRGRLPTLTARQSYNMLIFSHEPGATIDYKLLHMEELARALGLSEIMIQGLLTASRKRSYQRAEIGHLLGNSVAPPVISYLFHSMGAALVHVHDLCLKAPVSVPAVPALPIEEDDDLSPLFSDRLHFSDKPPTRTTARREESVLRSASLQEEAPPLPTGFAPPALSAPPAARPTINMDDLDEDLDQFIAMELSPQLRDTMNVTDVRNQSNIGVTPFGFLCPPQRLLPRFSRTFECYDPLTNRHETVTEEELTPLALGTSTQGFGLFDRNQSASTTRSPKAAALTRK